MDKFRGSKSQKILTSSISWVLLAGAAAFSGLMIFDATKLSGTVTEPTSITGPFNVYELSKEPAPQGGYLVGMGFPNTPYYIATLVVVAAGVAGVRLALNRRKDQPTVQA